MPHRTSNQAFTSQSEAKAWFIEKISAQARLEKQHLTADEKWMLRFSESDPEFVVDPARMEQFHSKTTDADYEARIAGLVRRCYRRDVQADRKVAAVYNNAYATLRRGDHYLLLIIEEAIGPVLETTGAWTRVWRAALSIGLFAILIGPAAFAFVVAGIVAWRGATESNSARQTVLSLFVATTLTGFGCYLIRFWRRTTTTEGR